MIVEIPKFSTTKYEIPNRYKHSIVKTIYRTPHPKPTMSPYRIFTSFSFFHKFTLSMRSKSLCHWSVYFQFWFRKVHNYQWPKFNVQIEFDSFFWKTCVHDINIENDLNGGCDTSTFFHMTFCFNIFKVFNLNYFQVTNWNNFIIVKPKPYSCVS